MNKNYTAALDLGSGKIRIALAISNSNFENEIIAISEHTHKGIKRGLVMNIDETVKAIKACVKDIFQQTGIQVEKVNLNCNGQHIRMHKKRLSFNINPNESEINQVNFKKLINNEYDSMIEDRQEIIQAIPGSVHRNKHGTNNTDSAAQKEIDFSILTGNKTAIANLKKAVNLAGLEVNELVPEPLASSRSVLSSKEKEEGVVLVDIGRDTTNVSFFHQNTLQKYLVFPAGSGHINEMLILAFKITNKQAEALKLKYGIILKEHFSKQDEIFIEETNINKQKRIAMSDFHFVIQVVTKDIINAILPSYKGANIVNSLKHGIVITGGAAKLKHLDLLIKKMTGCKVRLGIPKCSDDTKAFVEINKPSYACAIGLLSNH
jgi:cell division protein FtsA